MSDYYRIKRYCLKTDILTNKNRVVLLKDCGEFVKELLNLIEEARENIIIEFYEIASDSFGLKISELLIKKARENVKIKIIYDSLGSILTDSAFFKRLKENKIEVAEYHPVNRFYSVHKFFRRNHRKMIAVDDRKAIIGGFNLSLDYVPYDLGGANWKDNGVAIEGESVDMLYRLFYETWDEIKKTHTEYITSKPFDKNFSVPLIVLSGSGLRKFYSIRRNYKYAIDNSRNYIYITNAYFLPDRLIYRKLVQAVRRGVEVKIIVPKKTDHPYVRLASLAMFPYMIKNGIEIYEWQGEILHSKTAVIDDFWVSIGSHNLDHRSLHYNLELNVNIFDENIAIEARTSFLKDLSNCKKISLEDYQKRNLSSKVLSQILYLFRSWL
jgi:cardiolipin synthase